jgi:monovalent cation:H+ antiporter, CPA1 family
MNLFDIMSLLISVAAAFSYINYRYIRLPTTIGLMLISLTLSLLLILLGQFLFPVGEVQVRRLLAVIDFNQALMQGMLGFLLFAGALHININDLMEDKWAIGVFATVGVVISTVVVGVAMYLLSHWLGFPLSLIHCFLFGALISPTDPIAVLATLKEIDASRRLSARIAGESLFNDGIGVVVFIEVLLIATGSRAASCV